MVQSAMGRMKPVVRNCFDRFNEPGVLRVRLTVQPSGTVTGSIVGSFSGTATGRCAAPGIKALRFPRFSGPAITFDYPFSLR
jgi:hypothetical protein